MQECIKKNSSLGLLCSDVTIVVFPFLFFFKAYFKATFLFVNVPVASKVEHEDMRLECEKKFSVVLSRKENAENKNALVLFCMH